jgi:DNA-binding protein H-NS
MARSLELDALSEEDMMHLLDELLIRLTAQQLRDVRDTAEARRREKLEEAKNAVLAETRAKLGALELTLEEAVRPRSRRTSGRRTRRDSGSTLPAKYRGPQGEIWAGKGRVPQWLRALEESGRNRDEFLVTQDEQEVRET